MTSRAIKLASKHKGVLTFPVNDVLILTVQDSRIVFVFNDTLTRGAVVPNFFFVEPPQFLLQAFHLCFGFLCSVFLPFRLSERLTVPVLSHRLKLRILCSHSALRDEWEKYVVTEMSINVCGNALSK